MLATVLSFVALIGTVTVGYLSYRSTRRLNQANEAKARADVGHVDVTTEEVWQRLYGQTVEELERTVTESATVKQELGKLRDRLRRVEKDVIILKAELIRHGGDPLLLTLATNGEVT